MTVTKIISFILVFIVAMLPVLFNTEKFYKSKLVKTATIIFLACIFLVNIVMMFLENKEKKNKNKESEELKTKIDLQLDQLSNLQLENTDLKNQIFSQMDRIKLNAELDNYIIRFDVYVVLDKMYKYEYINPTSFGYDFSVPEKDLAFTEVFVTDNNLSSNKGLMLSYKIYDVKRGGDTIGGSLHGGFDTHVNHLHSEILVLPNTYTIRNISGSRFTIIINPNIVDKVVRIVFTVNDWIIINQIVDKTKWERLNDITKLGGWQNYGLGQKEFYRIDPEYSMHNPNNPWIIDLFKHPLQKLK